MKIGQYWILFYIKSFRTSVPLVCLFSLVFWLCVCLYFCFIYLILCWVLCLFVCFIDSLCVSTTKKRSVCSVSWACLLYNTCPYLHFFRINDVNDDVGGDADDCVDNGCVDGNDVFPIMHNRHLLQQHISPAHFDCHWHTWDMYFLCGIFLGQFCIYSFHV